MSERYTIKAYSDDGARCHIRRDLIEGTRYGIVGRGATNMNQTQYDAYKRAIHIIERNADGDLARALDLLESEFDEVYQTT